MIAMETGAVFGRWTVLALAPRDQWVGRSAHWLCRCECGTQRAVRGPDLRHGRSTQCSSCVNRTHGGSQLPEFCVWHSMLQRCCNPRLANYKNYGGRGITVCERWLEFANFLEDMGDRPSAKHSIDRIDNDKGYSKENCRWATQSQQRRNARSNRLLAFNGSVKCVTEWSEHLGIPRHVLQLRLNRGWSIKRTLSTPARNYNVSPSRVTAPILADRAQ